MTYMLGNPHGYRSWAIFCAKRSMQCASRDARDKLAHMARICMKLAAQLEEVCALLDEWGRLSSPVRTSLV